MSSESNAGHLVKSLNHLRSSQILIFAKVIVGGSSWQFHQNCHVMLLCFHGDFFCRDHLQGHVARRGNSIASPARHSMISSINASSDVVTCAICVCILVLITCYNYISTCIICVYMYRHICIYIYTILYVYLYVNLYLYPYLYFHLLDCRMILYI